MLAAPCRQWDQIAAALGSERSGFLDLGARLDEPEPEPQQIGRVAGAGGAFDQRADRLDLAEREGDDVLAVVQAPHSVDLSDALAHSPSDRLRVEVGVQVGRHRVGFLSIGSP